MHLAFPDAQKISTFFNCHTLYSCLVFAQSVNQPPTPTQPKQMQTLTNSFHNTSIRVRTSLTWEQIEHRAYNGDKAVKRLKARIRRRLCGMADCKCGAVR